MDFPCDLFSASLNKDLRTDKEVLPSTLRKDNGRYPSQKSVRDQWGLGELGCSDSYGKPPSNHDSLSLFNNRCLECWTCFALYYFFSFHVCDCIMRNTLFSWLGCCCSNITINVFVQWIHLLGLGAHFSGVGMIMRKYRCFFCHHLAISIYLTFRVHGHPSSILYFNKAKGHLDLLPNNYFRHTFLYFCHYLIRWKTRKWKFKCLTTSSRYGFNAMAAYRASGIGIRIH